MDNRILKYFLLILFFLFVYFGRNNKYLYYGGLLVIILGIIIYSTFKSIQSKKELAKRGVTYNTEYLNKQGDEALFDEAIMRGELKIFNSRKKFLFPIILLFGCGMLVFGILSLYEAFYIGINAFMFFGIVSTILGLGAPFLFLFEDKRILRAAIRRNKFVQIAKKRWFISKLSYSIMIFIAVIVTFFIFNHNPNILEYGSIYSNGRLAYAGIGYHLDIIQCFESSVPYWIPHNCSVVVYKINTNDLRQVLDSKIREKIFQVQGVNVSEYGLDLCLINKNPNLSYNQIWLSSIGDKKTVKLSANCRIGSFDYSPDDLSLVEKYCPNYQNCYGYQKTCCIGIFN